MPYWGLPVINRDVHMRKSVEEAQGAAWYAPNMSVTVRVSKLKQTSSKVSSGSIAAETRCPREVGFTPLNDRVADVARLQFQGQRRHVSALSIRVRLVLA